MTVIEIPAIQGCEVPTVAEAVHVALTAAVSAPAWRPHREPGPCPLSEQELRIVRHAAQGLGTAGTAAALGLSEQTVKTHRHRLFHKLAATGIEHAVMIACRNGWLPEYLPDPAPHTAPRYLPGQYARQPITTVHLPEHDTEGARA